MKWSEIDQFAFFINDFNSASVGVARYAITNEGLLLPWQLFRIIAHKYNLLSNCEKILAIILYQLLWLLSINQRKLAIKNID